MKSLNPAIKADDAMSLIPSVDEFVRTLSVRKKIFFSRLLIRSQTATLKSLCTVCYERAIITNGDVQPNDLCEDCKKSFLFNNKKVVDWLNEQHTRKKDLRRK